MDVEEEKESNLTKKNTTAYRHKPGPVLLLLLHQHRHLHLLLRHLLQVNIPEMKMIVMITIKKVGKCMA